MAEVAAETGVKRVLEDAEVADVEAKKLRAEEAETVEAPSTAEDDGAAADAATEEPTPSTSEPIVVGYKSFESGTALYEYYKMLHSKLRKYQDLNEYEFHMVIELVKQGHPEAERKLAGGVKAIQLQDKEYDGKRSSCFHLLRPDGSIEDVSYRKCISGLDSGMGDVFAKEDGKQAAKRSSDKPSGKPAGRGRGSGGRGRGRGTRGRR